MDMPSGFSRGTYILGKLFHDVSRRVVTRKMVVFHKGTSPKSPKDSGLGIILICPDILNEEHG